MMTATQEAMPWVNVGETRGTATGRRSTRLWVALALGAFACGKAEGYAKPPIPVRVTTVREASGADQDLRFSGTVAAEAESGLSFKVGGYATSILTVRQPDGRVRLVQAGDRVRRGTVLARVRQEDYRHSAAEARGNLQAARAAAVQAHLDHDRAARLLASGTIPQAEYDAVKARTDGASAAVDAAAARVANAQIALADASLRAPADALVLARSVEIGDLVTPSTVAFRLADMSSTKVLFAVPDEVASRLRIGSPITVTADTLGQKVSAVISKLHPKSSADTRTFDIEATASSRNASLLLGMVVSVALPGPSGESARAITAPLSALIVLPRMEGQAEALRAFVVEQEGGVPIARQRQVVASRLVGNEVALQSGLVPGERLVVQGATLLHDGQAVQLVP
ncbi:MAG: efflux RND transporter periplasmic adaptor subunit [Anaeromyxobacteraceae bacterium]